MVGLRQAQPPKIPTGKTRSLSLSPASGFKYARYGEESYDGGFDKLSHRRFLRVKRGR